MLLCLGREKIPHGLTTVELGVMLHCEGCERRIREKLYRMHGVDTVDVDSRLQKVTVTGYVEPRKVLRKVKRMGMVAEYWPYPTRNENYAYIPPYYYHHSQQQQQQQKQKGDFNYAKMGGSDPSLLTSAAKYARNKDDGAATMFNDDNVNACSVM